MTKKSVSAAKKKGNVTQLFSFNKVVIYIILLLTATKTPRKKASKPDLSGKITFAHLLLEINGDFTRWRNLFPSIVKTFANLLLNFC